MEMHMAAGDSTQRVLRQLFETSGLQLTLEDLAIVSELYTSFAGQRERLAGVAEPGTEPMTIAALDRERPGAGATDEPIRE
jgi:hypothetical protein